LCIVCSLAFSVSLQSFKIQFFNTLCCHFHYFELWNTYIDTGTYMLTIVIIEYNHVSVSCRFLISVEQQIVSVLHRFRAGGDRGSTDSWGAHAFAFMLVFFNSVIFCQTSLILEYGIFLRVLRVHGMWSMIKLALYPVSKS
jgi:hypothetical protein